MLTIHRVYVEVAVARSPTSCENTRRSSPNRRQGKARWISCCYPWFRFLFSVQKAKKKIVIQCNSPIGNRECRLCRCFLQMFGRQLSERPEVRGLKNRNRPEFVVLGADLNNRCLWRTRMTLTKTKNVVYRWSSPHLDVDFNSSLFFTNPLKTSYDDKPKWKGYIELSLTNNLNPSKTCIRKLISRVSSESKLYGK